MKGYKILDENMCAIHGDGMTYELKEAYEMQGEIIPCARGYHFCQNIEDVNKWYNVLGTKNRVFEVEAGGTIINCGDGKSVASEITLTKEINKKELLKNENFLLEAVKQYGCAIKFIKNPSEEMKLEAVKQDGWAIKFIKNPSEAVQMAAVKQYGCAIKFIKNPSEEMKLEAVKQDGYAIRYIKNPSEAVKMEAVKQNRWAIEYISNPSEAVKNICRGR